MPNTATAGAKLARRRKSDVFNKTSVQIIAKIIFINGFIMRVHISTNVCLCWCGLSWSKTVFNNVIVGIVSMGGKLGVDIFVLITGYFMIVSNCKFTKVVKLYLTTLLYSLLFLVVAYIYGEHHVPSRILYSSLFPFGGNAYWFITTYLMLYIFVPYLHVYPCQYIYNNF